MTIQFPTIHIAESVLNRIANALEGDSPLALPLPAPIPPNPAALGASLNAALATPPPPVAAAPGAEQAAQVGAFQESVAGGSPFDGAMLGL